MERPAGLLDSFVIIFFLEVNVFLFGLQLSLLVLKLLYNTTIPFTADTELGRRIIEELQGCKIPIAL